jgi:CRP-like cAMP-binding protein
MKHADPPALSTTVRVDTIFREVPLFADLSGRSRRRLMAQCVPKTYAADALILEEGDTALGLFLIGSGEVEVFKTEDGQQVTLARLGSGDLLGEMALFDEAPRSASARALRPTECLLLTRSAFHGVLREEPELLSRIVPRLVQRLRNTQDRLVELEADEALEVLEGRVPTSAPAGSSTTSPTRPPTRPPTSPPTRLEGAGDSAAALLQAQHALLVGGAAGVAATARALAGFLEAAAEAAELSEGPDLATLAHRLPASLAEAGRKILPEAERVPEQILDRTLLQLRRNRRRKG